MMLHNNETQEPVEIDEKEFNEVLSFIGNVNTGVYHSVDCFCVGMMNEENKVVTGNDDVSYRPCAHCKLDLGRQLTFDYLLQLEERAVLCMDEFLTGFFLEAGCKKDGKHDGEVLMYPDNTYGIKVVGKPGLWRVYFECGFCGVKTRYHEAEIILKIKELMQLDVGESLRYGKPLIDRKSMIRSLVGVIA